MKWLWFYTASFMGINGSLIVAVCDEKWLRGSLMCCTVLFSWDALKQSLKRKFHEMNDAHVPSATSVKRNLIQKKKHKMQDFVTLPATDQNCCVFIFPLCYSRFLFPLRYFSVPWFSVCGVQTWETSLKVQLISETVKVWGKCSI